MWVRYVKSEGFYIEANGSVIPNYLYLVWLRASKTGSLNGKPFAYVPPVITKEPASAILLDLRKRRSLELIIFPKEIEEDIYLRLRNNFPELYKNTYILELDKKIIKEEGLEEEKIYVLKIQVPGFSSPI